MSRFAIRLFAALIMTMQALALNYPVYPAVESCSQPPAFQVVVADELSGAEPMAVDELLHYLTRITRQGYNRPEFPPQKESEVKGMKPRIYVGRTAFALTNGLDGMKMDQESWAVRSVGRDLILTGGRPRGTLYAVYDFLENTCDVHWFDRVSEYVPCNPGLKIDGIGRSGQPQARFRNRFTSALTPNISGKKSLQEDLFFLQERQFIVRNRCPNFLDPRHVEKAVQNGGRDIFLRDGGFEQVLKRIGHGFYDYVDPRIYWKTNPEYFGFTRENAPVEHPGAAGKYQCGMLCLTHPDVRSITVQNLKRMIKEEKSVALERGLPPPRMFSMGQMDQASTLSRPCPCPRCRDFVRQHGEESDLTVDFWNYVLKQIEAEYPDTMILGLAYNWSLPAPKTVKPHPNLAVIWCNWGWAEKDGGDNGPFLDQPLTHPNNRKRLAALRAWSLSGARLFFWDYNLMGTYAPLVTAPYVASNIKTVQELGCAGVFSQSNESSLGEYYLFPLQCRGPWSRENFYTLRIWLSLQVMQNGSADIGNLTRTFFRCYYGSAAEPMKELYDFMVKAQAEPRGQKELMHRNLTMGYLTPAYFQTALNLLARAESLCAPDSTEFLRVSQERLRMDMALLELWGELERQMPDGTGLPFSREAVVNRFELNCRAVAKGLPWVEEDRSRFTKNMENMIRYYREKNRPALLASVPDREYMEIDWRPFGALLTAWPRKFEDMPYDDHSASGNAVVFQGKGDWRSKPVVFSLNAEKEIKMTLSPSEIPSGGEYNLRLLGRTRLLCTGNSATFSIRVGESSSGILDLRRRVSSRDAASEWDVYVSFKAVDQAVGGSVPGIWLERIILVRAVPGAARPAEEMRLLQEWKNKNTVKAPVAGVSLMDD
jgi:hypothetical protein